MNPLVLSDLTWVLPKVLQKVPWQVRALFLAIMTLGGLYAIVGPLLGWPVTKEYLEVLGILAVPAGLPALSNVTVHKGTKPVDKPVDKTVEELAREVMEQFNALHRRLNDDDDRRHSEHTQVVSNQKVLDDRLDNRDDVVIKGVVEGVAQTVAVPVAGRTRIETTAVKKAPAKKAPVKKAAAKASPTRTRVR